MHPSGSVCTAGWLACAKWPTLCLLDMMGNRTAVLTCRHVMLHVVDVMSPASQACRSVLRQLLDQDWASKVFGNLTQLLTPEPQAARPAAVAGVVHAVSFCMSITLGR